MLNTVEYYGKALEEAREDLEKVSYDETGAKREHLLHRDLGTMISEKIEFTAEGARLKTGENDCFIVDVTAIDMAYANSEHGYLTGDQYLKKTVESAHQLFKPKSGSFTMYHKNGQDFTGILDAFEIEHNFLNSQDKNITINGVEFRNSISIIKLSDVTGLYNRFASSYAVEGDAIEQELIRKRAFTDLLLRYSDFAREYKKITELGDDILLNKYADEEVEEKFTKYVQYMFAGTRFEDLQGFQRKDQESYTELRREFLNVCKDIAQKNVFGEKSDMGDYAKILLESYSKEITRRHETITSLFAESEADSASQEQIVKMGFDEFTNLHMTPKQKELRDTRSSISYLRNDIENSLHIVQKATESSTNLVDDGQVAEFVKNIAYIQKQLRNVTKYGGEDISEIIADIDKYGLADIEKAKVLFGNRQALLNTFENLVKFNVIANIAETNFNAELCTFDYLTGLPNKQRCEERLDELHKSDEDVQVILLDLGFLKYFNKRGNREIGNTAIQTAGYILNQCAQQIKGLETFRSGGDEFTLIVHGNLSKIQQTLAFIQNAAEETGPIPNNGRDLDHYTPESLQFNVGYCLQDEATEALDYMKSKEHLAFSTEDAKRLDRDSSEFDENFLATNISKTQRIIANLGLEREKLVSRIAYLRDIVRSGDIERFNNVFPFSGKAVNGIDPTAFTQLVLENPDIPMQELATKVIALQGGTTPLSAGREEVLERIVIDFASERMDGSG